MLWSLLLVCALSRAISGFDCTENELELIRSDLTTIYLVHSFEDVLNGSMNRKALLKVLSISDDDRQLPVVFNLSVLRLENTVVIGEIQPNMCGEIRPTFEKLFILSPPGSEAAGILYGCNIRTRANAMGYVYDERQWHSEGLRYHTKYPSMSLDFETEICGCSKMVDKFIRHCVIAENERRSFEQRMAFLTFFVFAICVVCSSYVLRRLWK